MAFLGAIAAFPMLLLGMEVHTFVVYPLALVVAAFFASLAAGWFGTFCSPDYTRTRLLLVVGIAEAIAAVAALSGVVLAVFVEGVEDIMLLLPSTFALTVGTGWATWRFRGPAARRMSWDASLTLLLAAALILVVLMPTLVIGAPLFFLAAPEAAPALVTWSSPAASVAAAILGLILVLRFRGRGDLLSVDAAATLVLVGLTPLLVVGTLYLADLLGLGLHL